MTSPFLAGHRQYVQGQWGQVHVRQWGDEHAPALILLHQTPWNSVQFHKLAPLLARQGWNVLAPDTPGYGLSDAPSSAPSIEDYAQNLSGVITALGVKYAVVGGHHTGALIALALAARNPQIKGLILDNPPFYKESERQQRLGLPHRSFSAVEGGSHFSDRWAFMRDFADPALSVESLHLANTTYYMNDDAADYGHAAAYRFDVRLILDKVTCPALILSNQNDPISAHSDRYKALKKDWILTSIEGGSANILERPQIWAEHCLAHFTP